MGREDFVSLSGNGDVAQVLDKLNNCVGRLEETSNQLVHMLSPILVPGSVSDIPTIASKKPTVSLLSVILASLGDRVNAVTAELQKAIDTQQL